MSSFTMRPSRSVDAKSAAAPWGIAVIVGACALVAAVGFAISAPALSGWYANAPKPGWAPPGWLFGSAWITLSALMAVAASLVWLSRNREGVCCPLAAFGVQLALSLAWVVCFFGLRSPLLGFLDVCLLWVMVGVAAAEFFRVSRTAGWLMVPHWLWVSFAGVLNAAILLGG